MTHWLNRIGQSDGDTFASLIAKLGNNTTAFWTSIGYEGATSLAAKLTAARAALLDQITALRMAELDPANLPADVDTLLARLTAARAGYLDELAAANIPADIDTLLARLTALRAGYLDELDFDLNARLGAPAGASLSADLLTIDNLVDDLEAAVGAIEGATTLHNKLTAARAALLDQITAARLAELDAANLPADIDTLLARLTAARAGYLDELAAANIPADIDTLQNSTPKVQEVIIYPVAEDLDTTELTDDGTSPAFMPAAAASTNSNSEAAPGVVLSEDINFEQAGTTTIISIYAEFRWQSKYTVGGGDATQSRSKVQISRDAGATWVDLTDNFNNASTVYVNRTRQGVGRWIPTVVAGANQLMVRLVHWTNDTVGGAGRSTSEAQLRSDSYLRITYRKN